MEENSKERKGRPLTAQRASFRIFWKKTNDPSISVECRVILCYPVSRNHSAACASICFILWSTVRCIYSTSAKVITSEMGCAA